MMALLLGILTSCEQDEISLGDGFVLYKMEHRYFSHVGLDLAGGGTLEIITEGEIESYGYDATYVVVKKTSGAYFYFEKAATKKAAYAKDGHQRDHLHAVSGDDAYEKKARELHLPPLVPVPSRRSAAPQ